MMGDGPWGDARWHMMGQSGTAGVWLLVIVLLLLLVAVSAALVWVLRGGTQQQRDRRLPASDPLPAERILDDRLARGEIDEDTYLRTRALLGKD
jgi:uncharacterized membrane protein